MKNYKNQSQILEENILALELKRKIKARELRLELDNTYQELRPSRLFTRAYRDLKSEPAVKNNILETILSLTGGFLSKRLLIGKSNSIFKSLFGYGVQYLATKLISNKIKH